MDREEGWSEKSEIMGRFIRLPPAVGYDAAKFNEVSMEWMPEFDIQPTSLSLTMPRVPTLGTTERRCICGCKTTSIKTMNKHMKQHSQRLNIKTMRLASLTAIFRRKKPAPRAAEVTPISRTSVDDVAQSQDIEMGDLEVIPHETASAYDGDETDDSSDKEHNDRNGDEEPMVVSDSEDEFESEREDVDPVGNECGADRGILEFELKAAEAGKVPCCI